jgi:hypothetical protein
MGCGCRLWVLYDQANKRPSLERVLGFHMISRRLFVVFSPDHETALYRRGTGISSGLHGLKRACVLLTLAASAASLCNPSVPETLPQESRGTAPDPSACAWHGISYCNSSIAMIPELLSPAATSQQNARSRPDSLARHRPDHHACPSTVPPCVVLLCLDRRRVRQSGVLFKTIS